ncbi:hypothetical protein B0T16DRAFT_131342 [Cercophora newfieldiana]|uniref:Uncharacterized protein n=1 Tax=Cercophora newfieldiana TaxID=92897 RepID=A0AA39YBA1_9PEZI|nr:hypothetical protein B0T16DRAFT_131342 [Cercophora newfieldiana]
MISRVGSSETGLASLLSGLASATFVALALVLLQDPTTWLSGLFRAGILVVISVRSRDRYIAIARSRRAQRARTRSGSKSVYAH